MKRLVLFLLACVMVFSLVSCGGSGDTSEETQGPVSTGATGSSVKDLACSVITVDTEGFKTRIVEVLYGDVENTDGTDVTVLDVVKKLFDENDVKYEITDGRITSIRGKGESESDGYKYIWEYKINGYLVTTPADEMLVGEGDHVIYYLTPYKQ